MADLFENFSVGGISRIEDALSVWSFNYETAPQSRVEVEGTAPRPVAHRYKDDLVFSSIYLEFGLVHPVHLEHSALVGKDAEGADACDENWLVEFMQFVESVLVQMVVVVVADQN